MGKSRFKKGEKGKKRGWKRIGVITGTLLGGIGLIFMDFFLIPTLNYFGKFIFFILLNLFWIWVPTALANLVGKKWGEWVGLGIGIVELGIGLSVYG